MLCPFYIYKIIQTKGHDVKMKYLRKPIAVILCLLTLMSILMTAFTVNTYAAEIDETTSSAEAAVTEKTVTNGMERGSKTLADVLGFDSQTYLKWLEDHDTGNYYLGTTYKDGDRRNPNGDKSNAYGNDDTKNTAAMNCTGFVWHVLYKACTSTSSSGSYSNHQYTSPTGITLPTLGGRNGVRWYDFYTSNNVKRYYYSSKDAMLKSGVLEKGDIIWQYSGYNLNSNGLVDESTASDYHHIGIYYGNGKEDKYWHSGPTKFNSVGEILTELNGISTINPKLQNYPAKIYCVIKATNPYCKLQLQKESANTSITKGNNCYSLAGAVYNIYSDSACKNLVGSMTTDSSGKATYSKSLKIGDYWCKEATAPKGYKLDTTVHKFSKSTSKIDGLPVYTVKCSDEPMNDPAAVFLRKRDTAGGRPTLLANAEFTVKYYNGFYTANEIKSKTPTKQWVIKTDANAYARLDKAHFVRGDSFYYATDSGNPSLPLGTVSIQETKAPEGFSLNPDIFVGQLKNATDGITWITSNAVKQDSILAVDETSQNAYVGVYKIDEDGNTVQGALYGLYSTNATGDRYKLAEKVTGEDGLAIFDYAVPVGKMVYIKEISAPVGYELDPKFYSVMPTEANKTVTTAATVTVIENITTGNIEILKTSDDGFIDGIWFRVTDSNGKSYPDVCTEIVERDGKQVGVAYVTNLPVYNKDGSPIQYKIEELGFKNADGTYTFPDFYESSSDLLITLASYSDNDYNYTAEYYNSIKTASFLVYKTSDDNRNEGVYFRITSSDDQEFDIVTDANGIARADGLKCYDFSGNPIKYYIREMGIKDPVNGSLSIPMRYKNFGVESEEIETEYIVGEGWTNADYTDHSGGYAFEVHNELEYGDIQITKSSEDDVIEGVYFRITSSDGQEIADIATDENGIANITHLRVFDDNNNRISYTVTELGLKDSKGKYYFPEKYVKQEPQTQTLDENDTEPLTFSFVNNITRADVSLIKTSDDGKVENLYFNLSDNQGNDYGDFSTDENGHINFGSLQIYNDNGEKIQYIVKELGFKKSDGTYEFPNKYHPANLKVFVLNEDEPYVVSFENKTQKGSIYIRKSSDDGVREGLWFKITSSDNQSIADVVTDSRGNAYVYNLNVYDDNGNLIEYTVTELGMKDSSGKYYFPERYIQTESQTNTLTTNVPTLYSFDNKIKEASAKLIKTSEDGYVADIYFNLTDSEGKDYGNFKTDLQGNIDFGTLQVYNSDDEFIEYTVTELGEKQADGTFKMPNRYKTPQSQTVKLTYGQTTYIQFTNNLKTGSLYIRKSSDDGIIKGLWFRITSSYDTTIIEVATDSNGLARVNDLRVYDNKGELIEYTVTELGIQIRPGDYYFPEKYVKQEHQTKTLNANRIVYYNFVNTTKKVNAKLVKTSEDGQVEDIYFNLSDTDGNNYGDFKTDAKGNIDFGTLQVYNINNEKIKYIVKELGFKNTDGTYTVPYKYNEVSDKTFTLTEGEPYEVSFENTLKTGSATLTKYNEDNSDTLQGVEFKLYSADGKELSFNLTEDGYMYSQEGDCHTLTTDANGKIYVYDLSQGDYYFEETKTLPNYSLLKNKIDFTISGENNETLNVSVDITETTKLEIPATGGSNVGQYFVQIGLTLVTMGVIIALCIFFIKKNKKNNNKRNGGKKMKKLFKRSLSLTLTLILLSLMMCIGITANAAVTSNLIDTARLGSLTITKYEMPDSEQAIGGATGEQSDIGNLPDKATPLEGVEFTIYKIAELDDYFTPEGISLPTVDEAASYINSNETETYSQTTDENGVAKFTDLPLAIYYVVETDCPAQVTKVTAPFVLSVPMTDSTGTAWIYDIYSYPKNQTAYSDINLKKVDSVTKESLPGAKFTLYHSYDNETFTEYMTDLTTDDNGEFTVANLPAQVYYRFVETATSDDAYILDTTAYYDFYVDGTGDVIVNDEVVEDKTIVVDNEKTEIHKYVLDGEKGTKGIDNTANYGEIVHWEIDTTIPTIVEKLSTYTIVDTMSKGLKYVSAELWVDNEKQLTENTDYTVSQSGLTVTFAIKPTVLAGGKEVNLYFDTELTTDAPLAQDIQNSSKLVYTNDVDTDSTHELESEKPNVHTGGYSFVKTDGKNSLENAKFAIYATLEDAENDTNRIDTQVSGKNGLVEFKGLKYGGFSADEETKNVNGTANGSTDYWIVELEAPQGFNLIKEPFKVTINAKSHIAENNENVVNTAQFELPQTGGVASVVPFVGSVMFIGGAGLFLALKKRNDKNSK